MEIKKNKDAEYLYASARVRAAENRLIGSDKLEAALAAKDSTEVMALINSLEAGTEGENRLSEALGAAYSFIEDVSPDKNIAFFLRYVYDCNNIKSAIKCFIRGIECDEMLFSFGTVPLESIKEMPQTQDYSALPGHMREAAQKAYEAYAKSKNPQLIDMMLDRACFEDMLEAAKESGDDFAIRLVREKIDLVNILMCTRVLRMGGGELEREMLSSSLINGGELSPKVLFEASIKGEDGIAIVLKSTGYAPLARWFSENDRASLSAIECALDNFYMKTVQGAKYIPFGAAILCAYPIAVEYLVKNLRIILAGKEAGLSAEKLRGRVRMGYV
ncbi:MAG: V-type ATPase subunit [Clostridia bacterium]|nr:V-type ATPase subunit [Clostridia bacterium]